MFLSAEQLKELTGYRQSAAQIRWLRKNGVEHFVRSDGKPRVHQDAVRPHREARNSPAPNFAAIRARH